MRSKFSWSAALLLIAGACSGAFAANPTLEARVQGIRDDSRKSAMLRIAELDLRVDIVGAIAETTATVKFRNSGKDILEGDFTFALPDGAVVTGYALDINGALIDGVLVEPEKATRTYEARVRGRIDPGLARVTPANAFTTRVFPINPQATRTIRLRFTAPVPAKGGFGLPLATDEAIDRFTLTTRARGVVSAPRLSLPFPQARADWQREGGDYLLRIAGESQRFSADLRIAPVRSAHAGLLTTHSRGQRFFQITGGAKPGSGGDAVAPRVRIYWDRSLSRANDDLAGERALLEKYLAGTSPASIDLVLFNSSGARVSRVANAEALKSVLRGVQYRGATSFEVLSRVEAREADVCLVFSDGAVTVDSRPDFRPCCRVFALTSAPEADLGFLTRLTGGSRADVLRLSSVDQKSLLARLSGQGARVIEARGVDGKSLRFAVLETSGNSWSVVGEAPADGVVVLRIAGVRPGIIERRYSLVSVRAERFDGAASLWAAARVAELGAEDVTHEAMIAFSREYSVASPALSFLVLEQPADYVEARIAPPSNYPKEQRIEYQRLVKDREAQAQSEKDARLETVVAAWRAQIDWWNTRFEGRPNSKKEKLLSLPQPSAVMEMAPAAPRMAAPAEAMMDRGPADAPQRVAGLRMDREISVELAPWNPDRPYLKALDAAAPADFEIVFRQVEAKHGSLPAFYFDVAEWLHRRKRTADAMEMLLSALELPVTNNETLSMVADRLLRYGGIDRAIWLLERVARNADDLPQPRRSLALALEKRAARSPGHARADLERALALLNQIIVTPEVAAYDGIELVALMDANALLPKLRAHGVVDYPLDPRLRALLDVDLRVVIEWNTAATDMDLWVDEPTKERAYYGNQLTAIGGRLSNDMTQGYGPEEYLVRRAKSGVYEIRVNVYASDRINPNGTTVITAHLYRHFGRAGQEESVMELELVRGSSGEQLVGRFTVKE